MAERGHRVLFFSAVAPVDPTLLDTPNLEMRFLDQHAILSDPNRARATLQGLWNAHAGRELRRSLSKFSPAETVVHLHSWPKALSSSVVRAAVDLGFPVVPTLHDYFISCPTGSFFIHPAQRICHLAPMSRECVLTKCDSRNYAHKLWRVGRQWMQEHPGKLPSGISDVITISDLSEEAVRPWLPESTRMHRVRNFIEAEMEAPCDPAAHTAFTYVGRFSAEKGPMLFVRSQAGLGVPAVFVGDGPLREELRREVPQATITGWLRPAETRERMRRSRALVFPSLWYETQGLVVAEAAALGIPAIVPTTSAAREWVQDGVTGLLFQGGDAEDLARKIIMLRDDPQMAARMGREAYDRYWQNPDTLAKHCARLEEVYRGVLDGRPKPV